MLVFNRFLLEHAFQLVLEVFAAEGLGDDLALRIDQYIKGYTIEIEGLNGLALPEFEIADMGPVQVVGADRLLRGIFFFVEGYAEDGEILATELIIGMDDIWILGAAWTTPAGPKIDQ